LGVREDLLEVIDEEFRRIVDKYKKENSLCQVVESARVDFSLEVFYPTEVVDGLPCRRAVYFVFTGDKEVVVDHVGYDVVLVSSKYRPRHDHVIGMIEVIMFRDRCFIMKDVDEDELECAVKEIEEELPEEES
jgi:hypothetical protein